MEGTVKQEMGLVVQLNGGITTASDDDRGCHGHNGDKREDASIPVYTHPKKKKWYLSS